MGEIDAMTYRRCAIAYRLRQWTRRLQWRCESVTVARRRRRHALPRRPTTVATPRTGPTATGNDDTRRRPIPTGRRTSKNRHLRPRLSAAEVAAEVVRQPVWHRCSRLADADARQQPCCREKSSWPRDIPQWSGDRCNSGSRHLPHRNRLLLQSSSTNCHVVTGWCAFTVLRQEKLSRCDKTAPFSLPNCYARKHT